MKLLIAILKGPGQIEDILTGFLEIGITGATVLDGRGMGSVISRDVPIFAGLKTLFPGAEGDSQVVISVVAPEKVAPAMALIEEVCGTLDSPGSGIVFTLPVDELKGLKSGLS